MKKLLTLLISANLYASQPIQTIHSNDRMFYDKSKIRALICKDKALLALSVGHQLKKRENGNTQVVNAYVDLSRELSSHLHNGTCSAYTLSNLERKYNVNLHSEVFDEMVNSKYQLYNKTFRPNFNLLKAIENRDRDTLGKFIDYEKNSMQSLTNAQIKLLSSYKSALDTIERKDYQSAISKFDKIMENYDFENVEFDKFSDIKKEIIELKEETKKDILLDEIKSINTLSDLRKGSDYFSSIQLMNEKYQQQLLDQMQNQVNEINKKRRDKIKLNYQTSSDLKRYFELDKKRPLFSIHRRGILERLNPF